jgi:MoxR-like ATPase
MSVSRRILLRGKPGTGKTFTAVNSGLKDGQKVYQITMTPETPMAEIRGHFIQKGGDFIWHDGPAIMAWREGARLVINEIDRASEDVHSFLYAIMDDPEFAETTLPTGELVRPKNGFQLVATMNGEPDDLPDALQDRLPVDIEITDLHPDALRRLPEDLQEPARNTALAKSEERSISIRMWMEFASLREKVDPVIAAHAVFGDKAPAAMVALKIGESASESIYADGTVVNEAAVEAARALLLEIERYGATYGFSDPLVTEYAVNGFKDWWDRYGGDTGTDKPVDSAVGSHLRSTGMKDLWLQIDGRRLTLADLR